MDKVKEIKTNYETPLQNYPKLATARLLCDGTNLREGGEMKGKQERGVRKPVTNHSNTETS
jgi:hypothetical protein